ncbi:MAG: hypothetical protein R6X02_18425 [Enhygromyxa sp.]
MLLSLVLITGCEKDPPGTTPPGEGDQTADTKGGKAKAKKPRGSKGDDQGSGEDQGSDDENDPVKKVCPAETADFPEPYFDQTVLLRLPKGVTGDNFIEIQPGFARISAEAESVSCVEDVPGAVISFMALASFPEDASKDMTTWRDEVFEAFGYVGATVSEEALDAGKRHYRAVLDVPAGDKPEPAKALFQLVAANGFMYAIVMETHPNAWNALKQTFTAVADKMSFLKPQ